RRDIMLDNYVKTVNIEALTMIDMAKTQILPAVSAFAADKASALIAKKQATGVSCGYDAKIVDTLSKAADDIDGAVTVLEKAAADLAAIDDVVKQSEFVRDTLIPAMDALRSAADASESVVSRDSWPFPTYVELLFGV
ncbi:MAG: glutamine synthetase type III, partial [Oscillospiraceae bacterium]|nr:glutamine synthetase type III [Oscillospiraceae bacterium]